MNNSHIIDILDSAPLANLSEAQMKLVRAHIETCASCAGSFEAASLTAQVIHERAAMEIEPSPFFATKVLANIREQAENVPIALRLWRSASFFLSSMAVTTAALAVLSFVIPAPTVGSEGATTAYTAESVILGDDEGQMSYEQILSTIYSDEDEANSK